MNKKGGSNSRDGVGLVREQNVDGKEIYDSVGWVSGWLVTAAGEDRRGSIWSSKADTVLGA